MNWYILIRLESGDETYIIFIQLKYKYVWEYIRPELGYVNIDIWSTLD